MKKKKKERWCRKLVALMLVTVVILTGQADYRPGISGNSVKAEAKTEEKEQQKRIIGKTETATIYDIGDGKKKAEIYPEKVRYQEEDGEFADYDTSLMKVKSEQTGQGTDLSEYAYQTRQSEQLAYFPERLSEDTPVFTENEEYQISLFPEKEEKKAASFSVRANREKTEDLYEKSTEQITSVDYIGNTENVTFQYTAVKNGVKENIILNHVEAGNAFRFRLQLKNCVIVTQEALTSTKTNEEKMFTTQSGEALYLYDTKKDKLVGGIPAAFMVDASGDYSDACTYEIQQTKTQKSKKETIHIYDMTLRADETYLTAPERSYPVTIDPTISWNECSSSAYVCRTAPNANYTDQNTNILCVGKRDTTSDVCRSYIKFEGINTLLKNKTVTGVRLRLNTYGATTTGMPVYVRRVTSSWNPKSVTYNSQPAKAGGTMGSFTTTSSSQQVTMSLPASEINSAVANGSWHGIELTDSSGDTNTTSANRVWIYNTVYINGDKMPKLEVVYTDKTTLDLPELAYNVYGKSSGWSDYAFDGETAGELSAGNPLQGFSMDLNPGTFNIGSVKYRGYFENSGWTDWKEENRESRETSTNKPMKAIAINVYGNADGTGTSWSYDVYYRVYAQNRGWLGWAKNGEEAGDYTSSGAILGIQAIIVPRLCYQEWYLSGGSSHVSAGDVYPRVPLPVGTGYNLYGIGICFSDEALRNKYIIQTTLRKRSGKSETINSGSWSAFVNTGGDVNDCITGFTMYFNDAGMRNKYDIDHMGAFAGEEEETWKKNSTITGASGGSRVLEMMSVRIVPKGCNEGAKACISERFVASENGFSFINSGDDFGYPDGYRIPEQTFVDLYGEVNGNIFYNMCGQWDGNCYGMSLTSQMFFNNIWKKDSFKGNIDKSANAIFTLSKQPLKKSRMLTNLIEHVEISWLLPSKGKLYDDTKNNVSTLVNELQNSKRDKYVMRVWKGNNGGHAVVPLGVIDEGSGNYKIRLYDVNNPGEERFAFCNTTNNTFSYNNGDFSCAALINIEQLLYIHPQLETLPSIVQNGGRVQNAAFDTKNTILLKNCTSYSITDENGKDINTTDGVNEITPFDENDFTYYQLPDGNYKIHANQVNNYTKIFVLNSERSIQYSLSSSGVINVTFDEDKTILASLRFEDSKKHEIGIRTYDKNKKEHKEKRTGKEFHITGRKNTFSITNS